MFTGINQYKCERFLFDIKQKGVTLISTMRRAATGIVTVHTMDAVVVWVPVWLIILLHILQKSHTVTA